MKIIQVPEGQTEESFAKCKISNLERIIDLYNSTVIDDVSCFDDNMQLRMNLTKTALQTLVDIFKETK